MKTFLGIIDCQRGFMPAEEGEHLGLEGFGELPIPIGHTIVRNVNLLIRAFRDPRKIFTTQDWHPHTTAHFDVWPPHCIANTPGAELHPAIVLPDRTQRFYKGQQAIKEGEEDTSYSGWYSTTSRWYGDSLTLRQHLSLRDVEKVVLCGLAFDYCVKATALDLAANGYKVEIISSATAAVDLSHDHLFPIFDELKRNGVERASLEDYIATLR